MRFDYLRAVTIEEAISLLVKFGRDAKVIAGGTDVVLQARSGQINPKYVVDITGIPDTDYIRYDAIQGLKIGALTKIRSLEVSTELRKRYPIISQAASQLGSVAIRNVATVGGNLCNALPSAETSQALLSLSAKVKIVGPYGERLIPLEDFFKGVGRTALKTGELLIEIQVPDLPPNTRGVYVKHSARGTIDLAIVNVAVVVTMDPKEETICRDIRIVLGAVASTPIRAYKAEEIMRGQRINDDLMNRTAQTASDEARPRAGSIRGSVEYKKEMVKIFTKRLIEEAVTGKGNTFSPQSLVD